MTRAAGRRYAAADARRAAILEAALARFAQAGYGSASLARIAADAGTSAPVVVHHFGSKEGLLTAVLRAREERTAETFEPLRRAARGDDVRALFRAVLALAEDNLRQPGLIELYTRLSAEAGAPDHPAHAYFTERYERVVALLAGALARARTAGHLRPDTDPSAVAREVLAVSDGLQVQWAFAQGRLDFVGLYRAHLDRLVRALAVDGAGLDGPTA
ncbi:TetR/AcrR family transcriptional regulator [Streptomyces sp. NPDC052114]|uniref:TetR/AcrR family transcriptional regulator n=1 Tax=unclassified Streptomyces TaxID=2593676 RepID=UPI00341B34CE